MTEKRSKGILFFYYFLKIIIYLLMVQPRESSAGKKKKKKEKTLLTSFSMMFLLVDCDGVGKREGKGRGRWFCGLVAIERCYCLLSCGANHQ